MRFIELKHTAVDAARVRNYLNTIRWTCMLNTLENSFDVSINPLRILRDHLRDCFLLYEML